MPSPGRISVQTKIAKNWTNGGRIRDGLRERLSRSLSFITASDDCWLVPIKIFN